MVATVREGKTEPPEIESPRPCSIRPNDKVSSSDMVPGMPQLRNQLTVLDETLAIRLEFDVLLVPPEQIPFGKQQLAQ